MIDEKALILIAHSDRRTLMALYVLLDTEGYFVAPCFSREDLLKYCAQYKPELVLTSDPLSVDEGGQLLEAIQERSSKTRVIVLADVLSPESGLLDTSQKEEILRIAEAMPVLYPPIHLNGF
jgi:PleD family two-component response regulator